MNERSIEIASFKIKAADREPSDRGRPVVE
jgi:hypothetical protein